MLRQIRRIWRLSKALVANIYFGFPSKGLKIIGVTGTDGKTTTANLIYTILSAAGIKTGIISTIDARVGKKVFDTGFHTTNPGPFQLQSLLSKMKKGRCEYVVLEVTSHGLDQYRNLGIHFDVSTLTNITHEHLDYHGTFENYVNAKAKLFRVSRVSVINKKYLPYIRKYLNAGCTVVPYDDGVLKGVVRKVAEEKFKEPYNFLNVTAAAVVAKELGIADEDIVKALRGFKGVEGRMQEVKNNRGFKIFIDFAHTPNALENVLSVLRKRTAEGKKLITVFGCAGERDVQKRPMMARVSTEISDVSVFTAEDPRSEKVEDIIGQMVKGIKKKKAKIFMIPDRQEAINFAINELAKKGDTVVVCGKGHEKSMNLGGAENPWSDARAVRLSLRRL